MSMKKQAQQAVMSIDALLTRVAARTKAAEANTEAGGYAGGTSHPVADADDGTQDATEGSRSAENTDDVKSDQGSPAVDSTSPGTPGGQDSVQLNIGTNQAATGEDPAVETASAKGGKEDSDSNHPARTDNDSLDGNKFAAAKRVLALVKEAQDQGTQLLASIAVSRQPQVKKAEGDKLPPETVSDADSDASNPPPGKGTTGDAGGSGETYQSPEGASDSEKEARYVQSAIEDTIKVAFDIGNATADYLDAFFAKQSEFGQDPPAEDRSESGDDKPSDPSADSKSESSDSPSSAKDDGSEAPPSHSEPDGDESMDASAMGGLGQVDLQTLLQLLQGGEAMGGEQAASGMMGGGPAPGAPPAGGMGGAMPMGGGMGDGMGGDPAAMGGAPPVDPAAGGGAGQPDLAMLSQALAQAGVSPEAFEAKAASLAARQVKAASRSTNGFHPKTAAEQAKLAQVVAYIQEVMRS